MAETKIGHRVFSLVFAGLFLFSAVATSVFVVISIVSANNAQKKANQASNQASTSKSSATNSTNSTKLAGTQLTGFTPVSSIPSLQTTDTKEGTGTVAKTSSTVSVIYTGAVASTGKIFQSSLDNGPSPVTFPLTQVIPGWTKGIPGMKVGGTRRLLIPASLAYGSSPPSGSGIPSNADLVFDVTLLNVK